MPRGSCNAPGTSNPRSARAHRESTTCKRTASGGTHDHGVGGDLRGFWRMKSFGDGHESLPIEWVNKEGAVDCGLWPPLRPARLYGGAACHGQPRASLTDGASWLLERNFAVCFGLGGRRGWGAWGWNAFGSKRAVWVRQVRT
jgi:hypothetical protein